MTPSIRTFLLINLFLSVTLITSLSIIGNLVLSHKDIQRQLDTQLIHTAVSILALLNTELGERDWQKIQESLVSSRKQSVYFSLPSPRRLPQAGGANTQLFMEFQVWDKSHHLILHSAGAPEIPFSNEEAGLSNNTLSNQSWRVYTSTDPKTQFTLMLAEHINYRQALENRLTQDSIYIMLLSYPFLALLIWFIVGKALYILKRVTREVSHRAPSYLDPFDLAAVPAEIIPLVQALNNLFGRLRDAFEREKRFTADAAHELKTPLAAISAQAQVALRTSRDCNHEALTKILEGVNRSNHVIQQLLTMSRMVPEATTQNFTDVKLEREIADIAAMLAPEAIQKNIELEFLSPDSSATIYGNITAIGILIRNLIDNAIRYTPKNGWVTIDIEETNDQVILAVIDSGPGIPPELRERVFERFYRIVGSETMGSGLGLGIVQQIAKLHEAQVVLSTPASGIGLEVKVIFPKKNK